MQRQHVQVRRTYDSPTSNDGTRVLVDLATASAATTRRVLRLSPTVLVPVVPDMSSVVSVSSIDSFFQHNLHRLPRMNAVIRIQAVAASCSRGSHTSGSTPTCP